MTHPSRTESGRTGDPRVPLAIERTLLAWVRTGLALMGFGFVVARLALFLQELALAGGEHVRPPRGISMGVGALLLSLGAITNIVAAYTHLLDSRRSTAGRVSSSMRMAVAVGAITGALGLALALHFAVY